MESRHRADFQQQSRPKARYFYTATRYPACRRLGHSIRRYDRFSGNTSYSETICFLEQALAITELEPRESQAHHGFQGGGPNPLKCINKKVASINPLMVRLLGSFRIAGLGPRP